MKQYDKPTISRVGDFARLTLDPGGNHPSGVGVDWVKGGSDKDPSTHTPATKIFHNNGHH